jgi:hypothetical protein
VAKTLQYQIIEGAFDILSEERRWTRCSMARNSEGDPCSVWDPAAVRLCAVGALWRAANELMGTIEAFELVETNATKGGDTGPPGPKTTACLAISLRIDFAAAPPAWDCFRDKEAALLIVSGKSSRSGVIPCRARGWSPRPAPSLTQLRTGNDNPLPSFMIGLWATSSTRLPQNCMLQKGVAPGAAA